MWYRRWMQSSHIWMIVATLFTAALMNHGCKFYEVLHLIHSIAIKAT